MVVDELGYHFSLDKDLLKEGLIFILYILNCTRKEITQDIIRNVKKENYAGYVEIVDIYLTAKLHINCTAH